MSLLNQMLKDINNDKSRDKLPFSLVVHEKSNFIMNLRKSLPLVFFVFSCFIFLLLLLSYKGKLAQHSIGAQTPHSNTADFTKGVTQSALSTTSSPETSAHLVADAVQLSSSAEWRPSVLVPIPAFKQVPAEPVFSDNLQDPFMDENDGVSKVFSGMSPKEWYDDQFNKALDYIEAGNNHEAIYVLELILIKFPGSNDARESLAAIYFSEGEINQAENIINEGLRIQPNALNLNIMKARILYDQNKAAEALNLLNKFHPEFKEEPDFYGLRAALLQSLGQTNEAGSLYKSLVELQPGNGQYWLGYGIALEQKNAIQQAAAAYKRVTESFDVEPSVRSYAEERLKTLQG